MKGVTVLQQYARSVWPDLLHWDWDHTRPTPSRNTDTTLIAGSAVAPLDLSVYCRVAGKAVQ